MTDGRGNGGERAGDAWIGTALWELSGASGLAREILWRCDALLGGRIYHRSLFGTRGEAEEFAMKMRAMEPDQVFSVEAIKASTVWN